MSPDSPRVIAGQAALAERRALLLRNAPSNLKEEKDKSKRLIVGEMTEEARKFLVQSDVVQDFENIKQGKHGDIVVTHAKKEETAQEQKQ